MANVNKTYFIQTLLHVYKKERVYSFDPLYLFRTGSPRYDDFDLTFIWNLLSHFNQKV